jgi:hypothetical protein
VFVRISDALEDRPTNSFREAFQLAHSLRVDFRPAQEIRVSSAGVTPVDRSRRSPIATRASCIVAGNLQASVRPPEP